MVMKVGSLYRAKFMSSAWRWPWLYDNHPNGTDFVCVRQVYNNEMLIVLNCATTPGWRSYCKVMTQRGEVGFIAKSLIEEVP